MSFVGAVRRGRSLYKFESGAVRRGKGLKTMKIREFFRQRSRKKFFCGENKKRRNPLSGVSGKAAAAALPPILNPAESVEIDGIEYEIRSDFRVWLYIEKTLKAEEVPLSERVAAALAAAFPELPENPEAAFRAVLDFLACRRVFGGKAADAAENSGGRDLAAAGERLYAKEKPKKCIALDIGTAPINPNKFAGAEEATESSANSNGAPGTGTGSGSASQNAAAGAEHKSGQSQNAAADAEYKSGQSQNAAAKAGYTAKQSPLAPAAALTDLYADMPFIYSAFIGEYGIDLSKARMHWWSFQALLTALSENCTYSKIIAYRSVNTAQIKDPEKRRHYERLKKAYALPDGRTETEKAQQTAEVFSEVFQ